jgi:hypothetical protein
MRPLTHEYGQMFDLVKNHNRFQHVEAIFKHACNNHFQFSLIYSVMKVYLCRPNRLTF